MKCPKCGNKNPEGAKECRFCGVIIEKALKHQRQAQKKTETPNTPDPPQNENSAAKDTGKVFLGVIGFFIAAAIVLNVADSLETRKAQKKTDISPSKNKTVQEKPAPKEPETIRFDAHVVFDGSGFTIKNQNDFNWHDVKLILNPSGLFDSGYTLRADVFLANREHTFSAGQFTRSNGERFNPRHTKPLKIFIYGYTKDGRKGSCSAYW